jgi:small-conductance mechanosensitive channel
VDREKITEIKDHLLDVVHLGDMLFLLILGWGSVPFLGALFHKFFKNNNKPYETSYFMLIADHVSQAARIALVVYAVDCAVVVLGTLGFTFAHVKPVTQVFAKVIYIAWASQRMSIFKRYLLGRAVSRKPDQLGRVSMIDRLVDGVIYICTGLFLLDTLNVEFGVGFGSVFAFGSAGTLVVGLATKDIAAMFVSGLTLTTSNRITEGDDIRFGDGTTGKVEKIGWMQTTIRNYDEMIEVVPNSELGNQRVKNISRVKMCQVKQLLRFRYEDADKFPTLLPAILEEIKDACPEAITDGSRPFRAIWTAYKEYYLEVTVDTHFNVRWPGRRSTVLVHGGGLLSSPNSHLFISSQSPAIVSYYHKQIKPIGQAFQENRQKVLEAIYRAVKKNKLEFVTAFYPHPMSSK